MGSATPGRIPIILRRAGRWRAWICSGDPSLVPKIGGQLSMAKRALIAADFEFQDFRNHDDGLRSISVLGTHESESRIAIDEKTAAYSPLIFDHPVSSTVLTNHEQRRSKTGRA